MIGPRAIVVLAMAAAASRLLAQGGSIPPRPMTVQDLLAVEELGDVRVAPDGKALAIVIKRPRSVGEIYQAGSLWYYHRADVWIASSQGTDLRNLTQGAREAAGYWNPTWSPDSRRLALVSSKGGDNPRLYLWHRNAAGPHRVSDSAIDINVAFIVDGQSVGPLAWLDARRLLCVFRPPEDDRELTTHVAARKWGRAESGREPTASILDTYVGRLAQREVLATIDVITRRVDTVAVTQPFALTPEPNQPRIIDIAPNRLVAAWIVQSGEVRRRPEVPVRYGDAAGPLRLGMVSLQPASSVRWFDQLQPWFGGVYNPRPWSGWSPDSRRFALLGTRLDNFQSVEAFVVDATTDLVTPVSPRGWRLTTLQWASDDAIVVRGDSSQLRSVTGSSPERRMEWWRLDPQGSKTRPLNLTGGLAAVPSTLVPVGGGDLVGVAAGALWRLDALGGRGVQLTDPRIRVLGLVPDSAQPPATGGRRARLVAAAEYVGGRRYLELTIGETFHASPVALPVPGAELVTHRPRQGLTVLTSGSADIGPAVWTRRSHSQSFTPIVTLNQHLSAVRRSVPRWIDYVSTEGDSLKAMLLLPIGYAKGCRYPLVTWVYGGVVWNDARMDANELFKVTHGFPLNLQLLAAKGYAVLWPSMPLEMMGAGRRGEPYSRMAQGVTPAVQKVIELGMADSARLAVMGHSYGGYSTYALIAQTDRFKAAIGLAAPTDLISWYGTFNPWRRYSAAPHQLYYAPLMSESGLARMGTSPYEDLARYIRNSPLFHVGKIRTPLLIIHGDLDPVAIQQSEEMFTALHRLGKQGRFVRYWGEGHVPSSPANVLHMWNQILDWLNRYLPESPRGSPPHGRGFEGETGGLSPDSTVACVGTPDG